MVPGWYRALLRLLPGELRNEYASEMCRVVEEHWSAVRAHVGPLGAARFWGRQAWAVLRAAVEVRMVGGDGRVAPAGLRRPGDDDGRSGMGMRNGMEHVVTALPRAVRSLLRAPGFAAPSLITLAVGLGATAAIFTLVDAILLRPLPYPDADRIVRVYHTMEQGGGAGREWPLARFAYALFEEENRAFEVLGGYWSPRDVALSGDGVAERVVAVDATGPLLDVLGARAVAGRLFTEQVGRDGPIVVLGHALWQRRYGADPSVVGSTLRIDGVAHEVLGVMAEGVHLPRDRVDLWLPYMVEPGVPADDAFRIHVLGRYAADVPLSAAGEDVERLTARLPEVASFYGMMIDELGFRTRVRPVRDEVVGDVERSLWILLGAVGIVLLIAAANTANLHLVRAEGRRREVAVRSALGAGRRHLMGHFLAESLLVSVAAALLGIGLAVGGLRVLVSLAPPALPSLVDPGIGPATLVLQAVLALGLALVLGLYPWLRFGRHLNGVPGARGAAAESRASAATGSWLVVSQVALALVLLTGSGLLFRSFQSLRSVDPGFDPEGIVVAEVALPAASYPTPGEILAYQRTLMAEIEGLPGGRTAALGPSPLSAAGLCNGLNIEGVMRSADVPPPCVPVVYVGPGYWEVLGIDVRAGRTPRASDESGEPVVVVSEGLARTLWPDGSAIGAGVRPTPQTGPPWYRVIGVVEPVRGHGPDQPPTEALYVAAPGAGAGLFASRTTGLLVAVAPGSEASLSASLRRVAQRLDPDVPVAIHGTLRGEWDRSMVRTTFTLFLLAVSAATALVLGLVGLYGVIAYRVNTRRSEMGLRMAMGADAAQVRNLILAHSLRLVALGLAAGTIGVALLGRVLEGLLFDVGPRDPLVLAASALGLVAAAMLASWIPAARATRVDPAQTLRQE